MLEIGPDKLGNKTRIERVVVQLPYIGRGMSRL